MQERGVTVGALLCLTNWEFPKIRGTVFWGPYHKDPTIQGTVLGSPNFGNSQLGQGYGALQLSVVGLGV